MISSRFRLIVLGRLSSVLVLVLAGTILAQEPARRTLRAGEAPVPDRDAARALLNGHRAELGLGAGGLSEGRTLESAASGRLLRAHHFEQTFAGIPVEDSDLFVLTDGDGRILLAEARTGAETRADPVARLALADALDAALARLRGRDAVSESDLTASLVFRRAAFGAAPQSGLRLYWRIASEAAGEGPDGQPLARVLYVDAGSARASIAYDQSLVCGGIAENEYVTNHLPPGDPAATTALEGTSNVEMMFFCSLGGSAGPVVTGAGGGYALPPMFVCPGGVINTLGRYGKVDPTLSMWSGYGPLPALGAASGGGGAAPFLHPMAGGAIFPTGIVFEPILTGAAGQVIHWQNEMRAYLAAHPGFLGGVQIDAEVDVPPFPAVAVATTAGGWRVRFGAAGVPAAGGGVQANSASSTIILHEIGHLCWWRSTPAGLWAGADSASINEAAGDIFAMYVTGQALVGDGWLGPGTGALRTGLNGRPYADLDPEGDPHQNGEILMGSFWAMRQNLMAALGAGPGAAKAKTLFLDWLTLFDDVDLDASILAHLLVLDDNNANLANGTPDQAAIVGAFAAHGWPSADLAIYGVGSMPAFGAAFFDPAGGRASKLALSVLDPALAMTPVFIVAGTPGAWAIPGLGVTAFDITQPITFLVDGLGGPAVIPVFPASTGADGMFDVRVGFVPTWAPGPPIALQALVVDPAAPYGLRMSNGIVIPLP